MTNSTDTNDTTAKHKFTFTTSATAAKEYIAHRKELGMRTDSEYLRAMVEAGRKQLSLVSPFDAGGEGSLRNQLLGILDEKYRDWDAILDELRDELEEEMEEVLKALEESGEVEFSPRRGVEKIMSMPNLPEPDDPWEYFMETSRTKEMFPKGHSKATITPTERSGPPSSTTTTSKWRNRATLRPTTAASSSSI